MKIPKFSFSIQNYLKITVLAISIASFSMIISLLAAPHAKAINYIPDGFDGDAQCAWKADSYITCGTTDFWFDLDASMASSKGAVFHMKENGQWKNAYLRFNKTADAGSIVNDLNAPIDGSLSEGNYTHANLFENEARSHRWGSLQNGNNAEGDGNQVDDWKTHNVSADGSYPDQSKGGKAFFFMCGLETKAGEKCFSGKGGILKGPITSEQAQKINAWKNILDANIGDNCTADSGLLGFVLCPLVDASRSTVEKLIGSDGSGKGFLVELLTVRPLSASPGNSLYKAWEGIRNIALGLYIVIFALIIFGNGVGYDPYTIKKALPKLAIGVLLTFGSFYIMQALIDLSNLAGNALPAFLANITNNSALSSYNISLPINALGWGIVILLIAMFLAIIALIIGIAGLLVRLITIYALVLLAPIAFVAWVLPNTESIFKKWWKNLIKVLMMFPIVTGMLALSLFFQTVILTTDKNAGGIGNTLSSGVTSLIGLIIPLMALIMIPKTFKWGGEAFAAGAGYLAGKATSGTNKVKDMPGKAANKAATSAKQGVMASEKAQAFGAGLATNRVTRMFGGKQAQRNLATARSQRLNDAEKLTADMSTDQLGKVAKIGNFQEKVAAIGQLAKKGDRGALLQLSQASGPTRAAYELASSRYAGDWDKNIDLRRMPGKDPQDVSKLSVEAISKMSDDTLGANLAAGKFEHSQLIDLANNDRAKASMSPRAKSYIDMYSAATATTRPREGVQTPVTSIPGLDTALATHQGEAGDKFNTPIPPPAGTP